MSRRSVNPLPLILPSIQIVKSPAILATCMYAPASIHDTPLGTVKIVGDPASYQLPMSLTSVSQVTVWVVVQLTPVSPVVSFARAPMTPDVETRALRVVPETDRPAPTVSSE